MEQTSSANADSSSSTDAPSASNATDPNEPVDVSRSFGGSDSTESVSEQDADPGGPPFLRRLWKLISPLDHPVAWLAIGGAALVLTAALSSTTARWENISIAERVGGMIVLHAVICFLAERFRKSVPKTTQALAHLGAALFVPTGISVTAAAHGSWRSCIVIGGCFGLMALELQSWRWRSRWMNGLQVGAVSCVAAGAAAIAQVPVGLLLGGFALVLVFLRRATTGGSAGPTDRHAEAFAVAALAALTPILAFAARVKFGAGTIAELGATGRALAYSAPLSGFLAAVVFAILARSYARWASSLWWMAAASVVSGAIVGVSSVHASPLLAACIVPTLLVVAQLLLFSGSLSAIFAGDVKRVRFFTSFVEVFELITAAALFSQGRGYGLPTVRELPLLIAAFGFVLGATRDEPRLVFPRWMPAISAVWSISTAVSIATHTLWPHVWGVLGLLGIVAWVTNNRVLAFLVAGFTPLALGLQLVDLHVAEPTLRGVLVVLGIGLIGASTVLKRGFSPVGAAGLSALFVATWMPDRPVAHAAAFTGVCLLMLAMGIAYRHVALQVIGGVGSLIGVAWLISLLHVDELTKFDVLAACLVIGSVAFETYARRQQWLGGKIHYLFPSVFGASYALVSAFATANGTRIGAAMMFGIVAVALGVVWRLPAVAIAGSATIVGAGLMATWDQLSEMPTWVWLLLGGIGLLALAVFVERKKSSAPSASVSPPEANDDDHRDTSTDQLPAEHPSTKVAQ